MSASNWAACPKCLAGAREAEADALANVMASYGKIPVTEFDAMRAAVKPVDAKSFQTFREDYDITGAEDGVVVVGYSGSCKMCGLSLSFRCEHPIEGAP